MNSRISLKSVPSSISTPSSPAKRSPSVQASRSERSIGASRETSVADICCEARTWSGVSSQAADLLIGGLALQHLSEDRLGAREPNELRILVERDADGARLLGERLEDRLADPPDGVGNELHALVGIELPDRLEQSFVADRDELGEIEPVSLVLLHVGDDEPEVRGHQPLGGFLVALLRPARETSLFGGVGYEGELLDVVEVLVESGGRGGTKEPFGPAFGSTLHNASHPVCE